MLVSVDAAAEFGVCVPVALSRVLLGVVPSSLEGSGVVGRLLNWLVLKVGRKREVSDGDGGRGVGGRP